MVKNRNLIISIVFAWLLLLGAANLNVSATQPNVDQYTITDIDENTVTVEAEFAQPINEDYLSVSTFGDSEGEIIQNRNSTVTYEIHVNPDGGRSAEIATNEIIFLAGYQLQYFDQNLDSSVTIADHTTYEQVHSTDDDNGVFIYKNSTKRYVNTKSNLDVTVISHLPNNDISADVVDTVHRMDNKFENPDESVTVYIVPETDNGYIGYAFNTKQSAQYFWVEQDDGSHFGAKETVYHETVHVNQEVELSSDIKWINEGAAEYLGRKATSTGKGVSIFFFFYDDWYEPQMDEETNIMDIRLQDPTTWEQSAEYERGSRVAHIIDVALHYHTDGDMELYDAIDWMNNKETVTYSDFRSYIVSHTDASFGEQLDGYLGSTYYINVDEETEEITGNEDYEAIDTYEDDENISE